MAAKCGKIYVVKFLIEKGAYIHALDSLDNTALHLTASSGSIDVVEYLIRKGSKIDAKK